MEARCSANLFNLEHCQKCTNVLIAESRAFLFGERCFSVQQFRPNTAHVESWLASLGIVGTVRMILSIKLPKLDHFRRQFEAKLAIVNIERS